jgi:hypothetical protein
MATEKQQRFYQLPNGMWIDAMTGQRSPSIVNLKEALIEAASKKAQAQAAKVERERPEEYEAWLYDPTSTSIPKISDYSTFLNTVNEFGKILSRPSDSIGFLPKEGERGGGFVDFIESTLPSYGFGRGMQEASQGNTVNAIGNILLGGASALSGPVAGKVTKLAKFLPFLNEAGPAASTAVKVAKKFVPWLLGNAAEAKVFGEAEDFVTSKPPSTTVYPYPQNRDMSMTPEQAARRAAANQNRTDAQGRSGMGATSVLPGPQNRTDAAGNSGMGGRRTVYTDGVRPPGGYPGVHPDFGTFEAPVPVSPSAPIARVPMPALNPPTPEDQGYYGDQLTAIDKLYKQTLADIAQDEEQGQLNYARIGQAAQRKAAGAAQDVANQMASSTVGGSPAAAFGAEQMVQAPLVQQRQANRLNLNQLLAQLQKQKTQAGTAMDMSKVGLNRWMAEQRAANTRSQIQSGYQNSFGGM